MNVEKYLHELNREELIKVIERVARTSARKEVAFALEQTRRTRVRAWTEMEYEATDREGELMAKYNALLRKYGFDLVKLAESPDCEHAIDLLYSAQKQEKLAERIRMRIDKEEAL